ncbi:MAG: phage holin family protein [Sphingobacteriales bacterium]|nr:phage holin family protein [Sphingobacteriales bacterium]
MGKLIVSVLMNGLVVYLLANFLPGVHVTGLWTAIIVGCVIGLINNFVKPIISIIAMPVTVLTLGLFSFVINGLMIPLASYLVSGFHVSGILWVMLLA